MGSNYTDLQLVADETIRPGHVTFGVVYQGAFVVLGQHKLGVVAAALRRLDREGAPNVSSPFDQALADMGKRLDAAVADNKALTAQVAALSTPGNQPAAPPAPAAPAPPAPADPAPQG